MTREDHSTLSLLLWLGAVGAFTAAMWIHMGSVAALVLLGVCLGATAVMLDITNSGKEDPDA